MSDGPGQVPQGGRTAAEQREQWIEALKQEREGYVQAGKSERAKAVEAEIRKLTEDAKPARKATR